MQKCRTIELLDYRYIPVLQSKVSPWDTLTTQGRREGDKNIQE